MQRRVEPACAENTLFAEAVAAIAKLLQKGEDVLRPAAREVPRLALEQQVGAVPQQDLPGWADR